MLLFTRDEVSKFGVNNQVEFGTSSQTTDANLLDASHLTFDELDTETEVTLSFNRDITVDSCFLQADNVESFNLQLGTATPVSFTMDSNIGFYRTDADGDIVFPPFTETTVQTARLTLTKDDASLPIKIYKFHLMKFLANFDNDDRPLRVRTPRTNGDFYRAHRGDLLSFVPIGFRIGKATPTLEFEFLRNEKVAELRDIWETRFDPDPRGYTLYPRPDVEKEKIYVVRWENDFEPTFSGPLRTMGQSVACIFQELDTTIE